MALAMSSHAELERVSAVDALANALRRRILDGALAAGERLVELFELRAALELEAAHLMLERNQGRVPLPVHTAVGHLRAVCEQPDPPWSDVVAAHDRVHRAIVDAAHSPRISRAYAALAGEMHLFVVQLKPSWTLHRMAEHHDRLLDELESEGPPALRRHLRDGANTVLAGSASA
jgi:DNA-binding GntR family transcriptional regulator